MVTAFAKPFRPLQAVRTDFRGLQLKGLWSVGRRIMGDVEFRGPSAGAFLPVMKRAAIRLMLIALISLAILATLAWDGLLIFGAGGLIRLW